MDCRFVGIRSASYSIKDATMSMTYYFISDLHIGGDEALEVCDYEEELIEFLGQMAALQEKAELLIIGDIFGLW
jgi:metallophosphoesterase superfamily enzyme